MTALSTPGLLTLINKKKKENNMIFNFIEKHKFTTRLLVITDNVEVIEEVKLLGVGKGETKRGGY